MENTINQAGSWSFFKTHFFFPTKNVGLCHPITKI